MKRYLAMCFTLVKDPYNTNKEKSIPPHENKTSALHAKFKAYFLNALAHELPSQRSKDNQIDPIFK